MAGTESRRGVARAPARPVLCPYCGEVSKDPARCDSCRGHFDPLSRQATQNSMGPWFVRDPAQPYRPGCSFEALRAMAARGKIEPDRVIRGPTTNQFWTPARRTPGVAHLLGVCHNCGGPAGPDDVACMTCGATFRYHHDRQHLGLTEVRLLPGQAPPEAIAGVGPAEYTARPVRPGATGMSGSGAGSARNEGAGREPGRVPRWVVVIAVFAVVGALAAAAWIMGRMPGVPSPVSGSAAGRPADTAGREDTGVAGAQGAAPSGGGGPTEAAEAGTSDERPTGEAVRGDQPAERVEAAPAEDESLALIRVKLATGSEESLRSAAELAGSAGGGEGAGALRQAAERLLAQLPLRRLP